MPTPDDAPEVKAHAQDPAMTTGEGKSFRYKSPITVTHPKVAAQWARSLNGQLTPDQVTAGSGRKVWWRCKRRHEWVACVSSRTGGSGCPTCAGFYSKPLSTTHPELAAQWHPTRNGNLTPDKVTAGSARRVWWLCEKGHEWQVKVYGRSEGSGCPDCAQLRGEPLSATHPELAAEWHPTRNGDLTPDTVTAGSDRLVWWLCESSHEWRASVGNRARGTGCSACRRVLVVDRWPELVAQWHPTRNVGIAVETLSVWDPRPVWWRCERGHELEMPAHARGRAAHRCPDCALEDKSRPVLALTTRPGLRAEWHPTRNAGLDLEAITTDDSRPMWWLCRLRHEWEEPVADRLSRGGGCRLCAGRRYVESLSVTHPLVAAQWHPILNGDLTPEEFTAGSSVYIAWICEEGHEWRARIDTRTSGKGSGCPKCDPKRRHYRRESLAVERPDLAAQWHPTLNGDRTPYDVTAGSGQKIWWRCETNLEHVWRAVVAQRTKGSGCRKCAGFYDKPLSQTHPDRAAEWHPTRNGTLTPDDVTAGSIRRVWWQCASEGHEWATQVNNHRHGCPDCAARTRVLGLERYRALRLARAAREPLLKEVAARLDDAARAALDGVPHIDLIRFRVKPTELEDQVAGRVIVLSRDDIPIVRERLTEWFGDVEHVIEEPLADPAGGYETDHYVFVIAEHLKPEGWHDLTDMPTTFDLHLGYKAASGDLP